jgi:hypothetical protein
MHSARSWTTFKPQFDSYPPSPAVPGRSHFHTSSTSSTSGLLYFPPDTSSKLRYTPPGPQLDRPPRLPDHAGSFHTSSRHAVSSTHKTTSISSESHIIDRRIADATTILMATKAKATKPILRGPTWDSYLHHPVPSTSSTNHSTLPTKNLLPTNLMPPQYQEIDTPVQANPFIPHIPQSLAAPPNHKHIRPLPIIPQKSSEIPTACKLLVPPTRRPSNSTVVTRTVSEGQRTPVAETFGPCTLDIPPSSPLSPERGDEEGRLSPFMLSYYYGDQHSPPPRLSLHFTSSPLIQNSKALPS